MQQLHDEDDTAVVELRAGGRTAPSHAAAQYRFGYGSAEAAEEYQVDPLIEEDASAPEEEDTPPSASKDGGEPGKCGDATGSPFDTANWIQFYFILWLTPLISLGAERPLEADDVYPMPRVMQATALRRIVMERWALEKERETEHREQQRAKLGMRVTAQAGAEPGTGGRPPQAPASSATFSRALVYAFWNEWIAAEVVALIYGALFLLQPFLIATLVRYLVDHDVSGDDDDDERDADSYMFGIKNGYALAVLLWAVSQAASLVSNAAYQHHFLIGLRMRNSIMALVFDKCLKLSAKARAKYDTGSIVTMMSVDTERIWQGVAISYWLWLAPSTIIVGMSILAYEIGWASVAGISTMIVIAFLEERAASTVGSVRRSLVELTDERAMVTNEVLQGVRVIKFYDWGRSLFNTVQGVREDETRHMRNLLSLKAITSAIVFSAPAVVAFATFTFYWISGHRMTVELAYKLLSFIGILRLPIAFFPQAVAGVREAHVAVKRVAKFMCEEDVDLSHYWIKDGPSSTSPSSSAAPVHHDQEHVNPLHAGGSISTATTASIASSNNMHSNAQAEIGEEGEDTDSRSASRTYSADEEALPGQEFSFHYTRQPRFKHVRNLLHSVARTEAHLAIAVRNGCFAWEVDWEDERMYSRMTRINRHTVAGHVDGRNTRGMRASSISSNTAYLRHTGGGAEDLAPRLGDVVNGVECALTDINVTVPQGSLVAVVGQVGQGKSSVLSAILGEMRCVEGGVFRRGRTALVSQQPWIQNASLRYNVAYHSGKFNQQRYDRIIDLCQLRPDVSILPEGDATEIGERGINLSGGQRARVSLARAVYLGLSRDPSVRCDIFLMDDPLSAVDAHVGRALFDNVICGALRTRTRVLVMSSAYHLLPRCDSIVVVHEGKVVMQGTFAELQQQTARLHKLGLRSILQASAGEGADNTSGTEEKGGGEGRVMSMPGKRISSGLDAATVMALKRRSTTSTANAWMVNRKRVSSILKRESEFAPSIAFVDAYSEVQATGAGKLTTTEDRQRGDVSLKTYVQYFRCSVDHVLGDKHAEAWCVFIGILLFFAAGQTLRIFADYWPGLWATRNDNFVRDRDRAEEADDDAAWTNVDKPSQQHLVNVYATLVVLTIVVGLARNLTFVAAAVAASTRLHADLLHLLLRAKVSYFDVTPTGRILNRFSKDLDHVDTLLPEYLLRILTHGMYSIGIVIMCILTSPWFILILLPIIYMFFRIANRFRKSSHEVKRLEGVSQSPVYSSVSEAVAGHSTIRAFAMERRLSDRHMDLVDANGKLFFTFNVLGSWIAMRMDVVGNLVVLAVGVLAVVMDQTGTGLDISVVGLALVYSLQLTSLLQWTVRVMLEVENNMTAVERLLHFAQVPQEPPDESAPEKAPPADWPTEGSITMSNFRVRYRPDLPYVLNGVDLHIRGGEKVGIVGRTGAGKSSLMQSLFRMVEPEAGSGLEIDGVNVLEIGLSDLRSRITIIPQDPTIFSGTLRTSLDPENEHDDSTLWSALERSHLKEDVLTKFPMRLDHEIAEQGENLSVGQRQLLCVARALLRNTRILIMDEATASVDTDTDRKIQLSVRENFPHCTVLCIAHRLETIIDYDRVLVLDDGRVAEFDTPLALLSETCRGGHFYSLVHELGPDAVNDMRVLAQQGLYGSSWETVRESIRLSSAQRPPEL